MPKPPRLSRYFSSAPGAASFGDANAFSRASAKESQKNGGTPCEPCKQKLCGPNVTQQVIAAIDKTRAAFASWSSDKKKGACIALGSATDNGAGERMAAVAWDINELHHRNWLDGYTPCAARPGAGASECQDSVQVGDQCYYGGSVNYVIYGVMFKLCNDFTPFYNDMFSEFNMHAMIFAWKGPLTKNAPNYQPSQDWARAGYNGWPAVKAPAGDRACNTCPKPYVGAPFTVNWHWLNPAKNNEPTSNTF